MTKEVAGIKIDRLKEPAVEALRGYQEITQGRLGFDLDNLPDFELTPEKPNSARFTTTANWLGKKVGDVFVIVFQPGDGTGDQKSGYILDELEVDRRYPRVPAVVPRNKKNDDPEKSTFSEVHMPLVQQRIDDVHADPVAYGGTLDLLGLVDGNRVTRIGRLGQPYAGRDVLPDPVATRTVGYIPGQEGGLERFGDPHSVYNALPENLQIAAFLALTEAVRASFGNRDPLTFLQPRYPDSE